MYVLWFTVGSAILKEWNLVLFGTSVDPLEPTFDRTKQPARKMKTRDHDPNEGDSIISTAFRESMAEAGIILPGLELMIEHNRPKANGYKPPVYKPADKPDFEYITDSIKSADFGRDSLANSATFDPQDSGYHLDLDKDVVVHPHDNGGHARPAVAGTNNEKLSPLLRVACAVVDCSVVSWFSFDW